MTIRDASNVNACGGVVRVDEVRARITDNGATFLTVHDVNATRIELVHRERDSQRVYGEKVRVAELTSYGAAGDAPTVVELDEVEATALAKC